MEHDERLSGWKEIAAYLRRSVRSVQRWERELGLPVQRVRTKHGQVVFAKPADLDAWMSRMASTHDVSDAHDDEEALGDEHVAAPVAPSPSAAPVEAVPGFPRRRATGLAGALLVLVAAGVAWMNVRRPAPTPASMQAVVTGMAIEGRTDEGTVWTHSLGREARRVPYDPLGRAVGESDSMMDVDLDADGVREHLVPVRYGVGVSESQSSDEVIAITDRGVPTFTIRAPGSVSCGGQVFEGPWRLSSVAVSQAAGPRRVWASFIHHTWWPSVVVELGVDGEQYIRYIQPGWVMSLAEWQTPVGPRLVAGGILNEHERASLVLIDPAVPLTIANGSDAAYACAGDGAPPERVTLFPLQEVAEAFGHAYVMSDRVSVVGDQLKVELNHARVIGMVDRQGYVSSLDYSDTYWLDHRTLSQAGKLPHPPGMCPELTRPNTIRTWTPTAGWQTHTVQPSNRVPPPRR